jgi:hypothetical protein
MGAGRQTIDGGVLRGWVGALTPLALLVLVFAVGEGAVRLAIYARYGDANRGTGEQLDYAPYVMSLGAPQVLEAPPRKPRGTYRVLLIGSSTAAEFRTEELETAFEPLVGPVEALNFAQPGYIINQELVMLALYGLEIAPDLVLSIDGVMDLVAMTKTGRPDVPYVSEQIDLAVHQPNVFALSRAFKSSQLVNAIRKLRERRLELARQDDAELIDATIDNYVRGVTKMSQLARSVGAEHIAVLQPYLHLRETPPPTEVGLSKNYTYRREFMGGSLRRMERAMSQATRPAGTVFVSGLPVFDDVGDVQCFRDGAHLTEAGRSQLLVAVANAARDSLFTAPAVPGESR